MKQLLLLFILFTTAVRAQNPDAHLHLNITFGGMLLPLDTLSTKKAASHEVPHKSDTIYTADKSYTIIFKPINTKDRWYLRADNSFDRNYQPIFPFNKPYSSFDQDFGWLGNTQITIIKKGTREVMQVFFYDVNHIIYHTIDFKKGTYAFHTPPSYKLQDSTAELRNGQMYTWPFEHTFNQLNGWREILLNTVPVDNATVVSKKIYTFNNPADKDVVKIDSMGDMGHIWLSYTFKPKAPDGKYKLYVDSILKRETIYKNNKPWGTSVIYNPGNGFEETEIINDTVRKTRRYDRHHVLVELQTIDGKLVITSRYSISYQLLMNSVSYGDNNFYLTQRFDPTGYSIERVVYQDHKRIVRKETGKGVIDGDNWYDIGGTVLLVTFSKNYLVDYKWIKKPN